jgi:hypothetical protein
MSLSRLTFIARPCVCPPDNFEDTSHLSPHDPLLSWLAAYLSKSSDALKEIGA